MGRGFWQPKRPPAGTRLFCLGDSPIWGMIAFRSLAGWRELRLPRQEDALEADGTFGWPCSSILFFQRPSVPTDSPERVPLPPPRYLSLQGMWMRRFIHSPCHLLASFSPLSATHPLPVVPPLPRASAPALLGGLSQRCSAHAPAPTRFSPTPSAEANSLRCRLSSYTLSQLLFPPSQACGCSHGFRGRWWTGTWTCVGSGARVGGLCP